MSEMRVTAPNSKTTAFELIRIRKYFGEVVANSDCSFSVASGTIHGVVGENGAGKSTIMKTLYGMHQPDAGEILVRGKPVRIPSPQAAIRLGIGMVHQHFMLVPTLSVWQNVVLGKGSSWLPVARGRALRRLEELQREFGFSLDLHAHVEALAVGQQQQVEILKLLYREADILILDEPTAVLTPQEVDLLLQRLEELRDRGKTIVFISHKLKEILRFTQNVTVLREGKVITTAPTASFSELSLAEAMIGRRIAGVPPRQTKPGMLPVLRVNNLAEKKIRPMLKQICFEVRPGEILGIAGVEGNGQQELIACLAGVNRHYLGEIRLLGRELLEQSTYDWKQQGLAVIPPDRHRDGVVLELSVAENVLLGHHHEPRFTHRGGFISFRKTAQEVEQLLEDFDVRPRRRELPMAALSGGNQQKVVAGRELSQEVKLLVAAHPTRGVDIGAIEFLHKRLADLRDQGSAVVLVSSDLDEILALSDRIMVLYEGCIQGVAERMATNETQLGLWMTGAHA